MIKNNNNGSATLEMTIIMPIIIIISFMLIKLLIFVLDEASLKYQVAEVLSYRSLLKSENYCEDIDIEDGGMFSNYYVSENKTVLDKQYIKTTNQMITAVPFGEYSITINDEYSMRTNNISKYLRGRKMIEQRILQ